MEFEAVGAAETATVVPAGAWIPQGAAISTMGRLAAAGKLGGGWQAEAAGAGGLGEAAHALVSRCAVQAEVWGGADDRVCGHPVTGWVDWRMLCTALLCGQGVSQPVDADTETAEPVKGALPVSGAITQLSKPRLAGNAAVAHRAPSAAELEELAEQFLGISARREAEADTAESGEAGADSDAVAMSECSGVRFWFDSATTKPLAVEVAATEAAEAALDAFKNERGVGADADAVDTLVPAARAALEAAGDSRGADGLGGWHQLPAPHSTKQSADADARARARNEKQLWLLSRADDERSYAETDAHSAADATAVSLSRSMLRIWTDSVGQVRWSRMLGTLRALAPQPDDE
jgi:hypothetical protein